VIDGRPRASAIGWTWQLIEFDIAGYCSTTGSSASSASKVLSAISRQFSLYSVRIVPSLMMASSFFGFGVRALLHYYWGVTASDA